jgi:NitT/TauT family transport system permease protein
MDPPAAEEKRVGPALLRRLGEPQAQWLLGVAAIVLWLVLWELSITSGALDARFFVPPTGIWAAFVEFVGSGELGVHVSITAQRLLIGYVLGILPALVLGALLGRHWWLAAGCGPLFILLGSLPVIAAFPVIMIFLALGEPSKHALVALAVIFPVCWCTWTGIQHARSSVLYVASADTASAPATSPHLLLTLARPRLFLGLRWAASLAMVALIAGEFIGAKTGVGYLIWYSWQRFSTAPMYVGMVLAMLIGTAFWLLLILAETTIRRRFDAPSGVGRRLQEP